MNGVFLKWDSSSQLYDLWIVKSAPDTNNWALHVMGSGVDNTMDLTVAGTIDGNKGIGAGCGFDIFSNAKNIFAHGVLEDFARRGVSNCNYYPPDPSPMWGLNKGPYVNSICSDATTLEANDVYQNSNYPCFDLEYGPKGWAQKMSSQYFHSLSYGLMASVTQESYDLITKFKLTTLSSIISVKDSSNEDIKKKD